MIFRPKKALNLDRERHGGHKRILRYYFNPTPMYDERLFKQCYRMNKK
jgi:hypothetical protein